MDLISLPILFLLAIAAGYHLYSSYCTLIFFRTGLKNVSEPEYVLPPVSIIKPVSGLEEGYRENFASFCNQDYPEYEIVFALSDPLDPALALLEELRREFSERKVQWVIVEDNRGPNYKVGNLIGAVRAARFDILVLNDSDMRVNTDYLREVVGIFLPSEVGLVTCLYRSTHIRNIPAALHALTIQAGFIPSVVLARKLEGMSYAFGATICTSREVLENLGGLEPLRDYLADDYQMGNRAHKKGYRVGLAPFLVEDVCGSRRFVDYFLHQLRWAITQRVCRPGGYFASGITHVISLGLLLLATEDFSLLSAVIFLCICGLRIATSAWLNRNIFHNQEIRRYLWVIPFNDLLNSLIWFISLFLNTVQWKNRRFRVVEGGRMVELS